MIHKIYGIDYNIYACGGIGDSKIALLDNKTVLFYKESEMLTELAKLKENHCVGEIKVFVSPIIRNEYSI